ncbi:efflux RND transporter periplasmic adaptor subunit [Undibacter mobilis]|uniref:Efflux RND transporter periplasmic adaptor subunit n=1 Tax=Undibacter mobilis TaxID=2292256 RepID=A0A371BBH6_9BRAD|nr:efflux RND transporter periplasmic adaptor subunit [Undibacter mobilis]RDV04912.1 efflux RND transporter periplasmic adaptor subunit [Undibacter mobilis]
MQKRRIFVIAAVALIVIGALVWWRYSQWPRVAAVAAARGTAVEIVYATGGVEPVRWAKVASVIRDRIVEICDCEGDRVAKGDVLARLDDREVQAQMKELRAREAFLKSELERVSQLITRGSATTQAYERAGMDLQQVQGLIAVQTERINDYTIVSPIDGIVLRRDGEIGEIAEAGQILFRVGVPTPLQVVAEVNEEDIPRVAFGQVVLFRTDAFPDRRLEGKISEITPMGDVTAKTFRIKAALPSDTPLKPGMSVEANVVTREKPNALLVPTDAVQDSAVFVVDGVHARKRAVTVGIRGTRAVEVIDGLKEGERVVSPAPAGIKDGARLRVTEP